MHVHPVCHISALNAQLASLHKMKYLGASAHWPQLWSKKQRVWMGGQTPPLDPNPVKIDCE